MSVVGSRQTVSDRAAMVDQADGGQAIANSEWLRV